MTKLEDIKQNWLNKFKKPFVIAGPCSAETEQQTIDTAIKINQDYVDVYRAGIWKPRTRPNNFEGIGKKGLEWLKYIKQNTNMLTATEVANKRHVKEALKYDIDILWIGARSTVNPFTVQEIAEALEDTKKIILIKNPTHVDLEIWIGSLERLINKNIKNIGVIHRGFSTLETKLEYRNQPKWNIALEFKKQFPNIPIICDPSHITGDKTKILEVSKKALEFGYHGLMIETHINPKEAWSDANQQITPKELNDIIKNLINYKNKKIYNNKYTSHINMLRTIIDEIDQNLVININARMQISRNIGILKQKYHQSIKQPNREIEVYQNIKKYGSSLNISEEFIQKIFQIIQQESIKIQKNNS